MCFKSYQIVVFALGEFITKRSNLVNLEIDLVNIQLLEPSQVTFKNEYTEHGY